MAFRRRRKRRERFVNREWGVSIASGHIVRVRGGGRKERKALGRLRVVSTCLYAFNNQ